MNPESVYLIGLNPGHAEILSNVMPKSRVATFSRVDEFLNNISYEAIPKSMCIVCDMHSSPLSGLDLLDILVADDLAIPTVITGKSLSADDVVAAMYAGAGYVLQLPSNGDQMAEAIEKALYRTPLPISHCTQLNKRIAKLSQRQKQMLVNVYEGRTNREIADQLNISIKTVELHRATMMKKMGANSLAELIRVACQCPHAVYAT